MTAANLDLGTDEGAESFLANLEEVERWVDRVSALKDRHAAGEPKRKDEDGYDEEISTRWVAMSFIVEPALSSAASLAPVLILSPGGTKAGHLALDALEGVFDRFGF